MKLLFTPFALFFILSLTSSCSKDGVELVNRNFTDEMPMYSNLRFEFNYDIAPDSVLGFWDSSEYIQFEPALHGAFKWISPRELIFSPRGDYKPGQEFTAKLQDEIMKFSELKLSGEKSFNFHSPYLQIENILARWVYDEDAEQSYPKVNLSLNYMMDASYLAKNISVNLNGESIDFEMISKSSDKQFSIKIKNLEKHEEDLEGLLTFDSELKLEQNRDKPEDVGISFILVSPYKIEVIDVSTEHDGEEGSILIYTSQPFKSDDLKSFIHLDPPVDFKLVQQTDYLSLQSSALEAKGSYTLKIDEGVRGVNGGKLRSQYSTSLSFGELRPSLDIENQNGMFLSGRGQKVLELSITAIPQIRVRISKIYANNILSAINGYYSPGYFSPYDYVEELEYYDDGSNYYGQTRGDIIFDKTYNTKDLPGAKLRKKLKIELEDKLAGYDGIYHIHIASTENYWMSDSRFLSISDIGIIAKHGRNGVQVFCNSIDNTEAISGAEVRLYGKNNQLLSKANTDADGFVNLPLEYRELDGFFPSFITVKKANDFNFLPFSRTEVNTSQFDAGGRTLNSSGFECFLYPERDLYRPGETLHMAGILRDQNFNKTDQIPLKVVIRMPSGKVYKELRQTINEQGSFEIEQDIPKASPTGVYQVEVATFNDILLTSEQILVEEFIPDRIKVETQLNKEDYSEGENISLDINAVNFFGPPAANRNVEVEMQLHRVSFKPKGYESYSFGLEGLQNNLSNKVLETKTDDAGNANVTMPISVTYREEGQLKAKLFTTVFDENGRSVSKNNEVDIFTQEAFAGLKLSQYYGAVNRPIETEIVALDKDGKAINSKIEVEFIRYEYRTIMEKSGRYYQYRSQEYPVTVSRKVIDVNGKERYSVKPTESGRHGVRVRVKGHRHYVERKFWSYHYAYTSSHSFEVNKEGSIDITTHKPKYLSGETAKILFKAPFDGKMLVTIEQNDVLKHMYLNVKDKSAELSLKLEDEYLPNIYISATLFKKHKVSDMPLTVAHGVHPITVEKKDRKLEVELSADETSRSNKTQKIKISTSPNSYVSVAVVDEGILQMSGFETPQPYDAFYGKRALGVHSFDLYPYLFDEVSYFSSTAGDGMFGSAKMLNPVNSNRVNLVSYWSGLQKTDSRGNYEFEIDVPQFSGRLRIMAVAHKDNRFGSSEGAMVVADPIVQTASVPRFLAIGDTLNLSLNLSNTTKGNAKVTSTLKVSGPIEVVGSKTRSTDIDANSESRVYFKILAQKAMGEAEIHFETSGLGERFKLDYALPVRSAAPLTVNYEQGMASEAGVSMSTNLADYLESTRSAEITLGRSPLIQLNKDLNYLVRYPYGCLEQTVSGVFPQLYLADLQETGMHDVRQNASYNIKSALDKIKLHPLYNGSFTTWPGRGRSDWWGTIYATHFMLEAKSAGYNVDHRMLNNALGFLREQLRDKQRVSYYYVNTEKRLAPQEVAYSLYVLSLANKPDKSSMNYYRMNLNDLTIDSRYMLAAAYYLSGEKSMYTQLISSEWNGSDKIKTAMGGSYYSDLRNKAVMLNALAEMDMNHKQIPAISKYIIQNLNQQRYINTQERAWCFLALGKVARVNKSNANAELIVDGKSFGKYDLNQSKKVTIPSNARSVKIRGIGGKVYYSAEIEGVSIDNEVKEEDSYLSVRRTLYNRYGQVVYSSNFEQNDLIIVKIELSSSFGRIENLAIQDVLPAGFEVENMRLKEVPGMNWIDNANEPDYIDIRDDRVIIFTDYRSSSTRFYYAVRAVSRGDFSWAPVQAECMYNGEIHSTNGARKVRVN
ncbi:alpha-2-macroglobulin family protein [bacterium]|nr:alpha-2-macroglobulin family protein [bacterium]